MNRLFLLFIILGSFSSCQSQTKGDLGEKVGGPCEGCEAIFEYGDKKLSATDTLPGFDSTKPRLKISGTVFMKNGRTPAKDIILYVYHTNRKGVYEKVGGEEGWAKRHGVHRGWVKTGTDGKYSFYTFRPASYPNTEIPEHIHITIKEPNLNEYYIDDFVFDDDTFLTAKERENLKNRGGSGIVVPVTENDVLHIKRNIILGFNIPDY